MDSLGIDRLKCMQVINFKEEAEMSRQMRSELQAEVWQENGLLGAISGGLVLFRLQGCSEPWSYEQLKL